VRVLRYLYVIIAYSARSLPLTALAVFLLAVLGTLLEFVALSVLIPLSQQASHGATSMIARTWATLAARVGMTPDAKTWFEWFLLLMLIRVVLQLCYAVLVSQVSREVTASLASGAFGKFVLDTPLLEIQRQKVGHFIAIAGDEASRAGQIFMYFCQLAISVLSVLVTIAAMVVFSPRLALGVALFIAITAATILRSTRRIYQLGNTIKSESRVATSTFLDGLNGLRSVRSIGGESYVVHQYGSQVRKYHKTIFRVDFISHSQKISPLIVLLVLALGATIGVSSSGISQLNMASSVASLILLIRFFPAAGACLNNGTKLLSDLRAAHDVVSIAAAPRAPSSGGHQTLAEPVRKIELVGLSYRYDRTAPPVLDGLKFCFRAGESYAICGTSGSGKSTLVDLIAGLIPDVGRTVLINDVPIADLEPRQLRSQVVLVEQQSRIFNDTVRNNIVFGFDASDKDIDRALELACLAEVVAALPQGLDTMLDYQGTNLSGGQRQRVGLARAILRDPSVLILDVSLSALDTATRDRVLANVLRAFADRIVIVVTHDAAIACRLSSKLALASRGAGTTPAATSSALPDELEESADLFRHSSGYEPK
jgi:ABC-type bacteriocin/lantibiotic exporter with double-glycine peptidase domain